MTEFHTRPRLLVNFKRTRPECLQITMRWREPMLADEARSLADRLAFEQEVAAGAVAGFVLDELEKWAEREAERTGR